MKPQSTYQSYDSLNNVLTVHVGDMNSDVYFCGDPADYDGTATEPAAPTALYLIKHLNK